MRVRACGYLRRVDPYDGMVSYIWRLRVWRWELNVMLYEVRPRG